MELFVSLFYVVIISWVGVLAGIFGSARILKSIDIIDDYDARSASHVVDYAILIGLGVSILGLHNWTAAYWIAGIGGLISGSLKGISRY